MMETQTIKKWYDFMDNMERFMKEERLKVMESLHETLTERVGRKGWERKGKGGVTQGMVSSETAKYQFVKDYDGVKVTISLNINIRETYSDGGYKEITVKGGRSMMGQDAWWPRKEGSNFRFDENNERFYLEKLLDDLDRVNIGQRL